MNWKKIDDTTYIDLDKIYAIEIREEDDSFEAIAKFLVATGSSDELESDCYELGSFKSLGEANSFVEKILKIN
ncbi:Uncharacterised protein [uncultured archaeon]|nr:Uncharacterised protein [uncultured archaeon]